MNLSPRQLRIFVSLAQTLNFSRTAEQFCVSQPTLSKLVREIEHELGVVLFERTTRSVRLSADGEALVQVAARIVDDFAAGVTEMAQMARRHTQRLSIAALPTLAAMLLPEPVARLRASDPDVMVRVHDVFSDQALDLLRAHKVDLALIGVDTIHQDLAYEEIARERFVYLSARRFPPALDLGQWSAAALAGQPLVSMPRGTGTRHYVEAAFLRDGLSFRPLLELQHLGSIARFVKAGCGVAVLPLSGAQLVLDDELLISEPAGAPQRSIGIVTRPGATLPVLARRMIEAIRAQAQTLLVRAAGGAGQPA